MQPCGDDQVRRMAAMLDRHPAAIFQVHADSGMVLADNKLARERGIRAGGSLPDPLLGKLLPAIRALQASFGRKRIKQNEPGQKIVQIDLVRHGEERVIDVEIADITEQERNAMRDIVTGLPCLEAFRSQIRYEIAAMSERGGQLAIMAIGIDNLESLTEQVGMGRSEQLLRALCKRITDVAGAGDIMTRFQDCFMILARHGSSESVGALAREIVASMESGLTLRSRSSQRILIPRVSVGVSFYPDDGHSATQLLTRASSTMKEARTRDSREIVFYNADIGRDVMRKLLIRERLPWCIERNAISVHYQPIVEYREGKWRIVAFEALLRWDDEVVGDPETGFVPNYLLFPIAEETGAVIQLDMIMIGLVCKQARRWKKMGLAPVRIYVNLAPQDLLRADLEHYILQQLGNDLSSEWIGVEITEREMMTKIADLAPKLALLHERGVWTASDDFGTGTANLALILKWPVESLKIDGTFTNGIVRDANRRAIVRRLIQAAHDIRREGFGRLRVIAECVERPEQVRALQDLGIDGLQGFYFLRPVTAREATVILMAGRTLRVGVA